MNKLFIILSTIFLSFVNVNSNSFGWGFSKNKNHKQPYIGKYLDEIKDTNSYYVGDENIKKVYLTFDAGYDNGNLEKILNTLKEKDVQATFFITGDFLNRFSDLTIKINNDGHLIGNHTWSHANITKLNKDDIFNELKKVEHKFYEITGDKIDPFFRPPAGVFNNRSLNVIKEYGYNTIFWSIAYKDWETNKTKDINVSVNSVIDNLHNGAIILLHTVSNENVIALPIIIDKIREEGYEIASLNDLVIPNYNLIY